MLGGRPNKSQRILALAGLAKRILVLTLCDSHSNLTREAKTGTRLTVPSSRQKSEPNGSRERLLVDSCSMLSQRLPSWAASPPVGRCSLGDSFTHHSRQHAPESLATRQKETITVHCLPVNPVPSRPFRPSHPFNSCLLVASLRESLLARL